MKSFIITLIISILAGYGYIMNIVQLVEGVNDSVAESTFRIICIILFPLGCIVGYF